jgi:hypothetical protein
MNPADHAPLRDDPVPPPGGSNLAPADSTRGGQSFSTDGRPKKKRNIDVARKTAAALRQRAGGAAALNKRWREKNREKYLAHKSVECGIKHGTLVKQPCAVCGQFNLVHAHHDDYTKRRDVIWLCPMHHKERHVALKAQGRCPNELLKSHFSFETRTVQVRSTR